MATFGLRHLLWAPCLLLAILAIWHSVRRDKRPDDSVGMWIGMTIESVLFALMLWGGCHAMAPVLQRPRRAAAFWPAARSSHAAIALLRCAGIYEETLFRLLLFSCLRWFLHQIDIPWPGAVALAALVSALLFSAAHNIGPYGEEFQPFVFAFRTAAGLYFVMLYRWRGFGITVGTHAGYDVLVGLLADF